MIIWKGPTGAVSGGRTEIWPIRTKYWLKIPDFKGKPVDSNKRGIKKENLFSISRAGKTPYTQAIEKAKKLTIWEMLRGPVRA